MFEDSKIKIGFRYTDHFGDEYSSDSYVEVYDTEETDLDVIGMQLNSFLRQATFPRDNDYMLMESLTEEERDALYEYLLEMRGRASTEREEENYD